MDKRTGATGRTAARETAAQTQVAAESAASAAEDARSAAIRTTEAAGRTSVAAETSAQAAQSTATAAVVTKDSAERRTELAGDRTILAAERTYAAWVRTGLVGLAAGIGARELLDGLVPGWLALGQASMLMLFAIFCFVAGVWRQLLRLDPEAPDVARLPGWMLVGVNVFLALVTLSALVGLWLGPAG